MLNEKNGDILEPLNEEEIRLLVNSISAKDIYKIVNRSKKVFKGALDGCDVKPQSPLLPKRVRPELIKGALRKNIEICGIINDYYTGIYLPQIRRIAADNTGEKDFVKRALENTFMEDFDKLINIIFQTLEPEYSQNPEYIKVYLKLLGWGSTPGISEYIKARLEYMSLDKALRKQIEQEMHSEYEERTTGLEKRYRAEREEYNKKIEEAQQLLELKELEVLKWKVYSDELEKTINKLEKEIVRKKEYVKKLEAESSDLRHAIEDKNTQIGKLSRELQKKHEEFYEKAQEKWNSRNQSALDTQKEIENICLKLLEEKNALRKDIKNLDLRKDELEGSIIKYEAAMRDFIDNIDTKLIEKALDDSMLKFSPEHSSNKEGLYASLPYIKVNRKSSDIKINKSIENFAEILANNLEKAGVKNSIADEAANYIVSILAADMVPLICGYNSREIAMAVAAAYSGETPYIVSLPNGYTNAGELISLYKSSDAGVVLIEDAVGTMNENSLLPLLRERKESGSHQRILLISAENSDSIKYMPKNLLNYVAVIAIDKIGIAQNNCYQFSDSRGALEQFSVEQGFSREQKKVKELLYLMGFSNPYKMLRGCILAYSSRLSDFDKALKGYVGAELKMLCKFDNLYYQIEKNISACKFDQELKCILKEDPDE